MSADHPGRNYYEDQFGERIRAIGRGGSPPPSTGDRSSGSGTGAKTAGGVGGVILMVLVFGGLRAWRATTTPTPSYNYPPPRIQIPQQPPNVNMPLGQPQDVPDFGPGNGLDNPNRPNPGVPELPGQPKGWVDQPRLPMNPGPPEKGRQFP
jgi:hypothetical protein